MDSTLHFANIMEWVVVKMVDLLWIPKVDIIPQFKKIIIIIIIIILF